MRLALEVIRRDIAITRRYRLDVGLRLAGIALQLALFFFIGRLISPSGDGPLSITDGSYFHFVLVGLIFTPLFSFGISYPSSLLRDEVNSGTLQQVMAFPYRLEFIICSMGASKALVAIAESVGILSAGYVFFGIPWRWGGMCVMLWSMSVAIALYGGIGLVAASFILRFKRGDPVQWVLINASDLLGGVYFPVSVLPAAIGAVSLIIPATHILTLARKSIFETSLSTADYLTLAVLTGVSILFLWAGFFLFKHTFRIILKRGSLSHR